MEQLVFVFGREDERKKEAYDNPTKIPPPLPQKPSSRNDEKLMVICKVSDFDRAIGTDPSHSKPYTVHANDDKKIRSPQKLARTWPRSVGAGRVSKGKKGSDCEKRRWESYPHPSSSIDWSSGRAPMPTSELEQCCRQSKIKSISVCTWLPHWPPWM